MKKAIRKNFVTYLIIFWLIVSLAGLTWGGYAWTIEAGLFSLQKIRFTGNSIVSKTELRNIMNNMESTSLFNLDLVELSKKIDQHPYIAATRISRRYPHQLIVEVIERNPIALVNIDPLVLLDQDGIVLPLVAQTYEFQIPTLSGFNPDPGLYPIGQPVLSVKMKETVNVLVEVYKHIDTLYDEISEITLNQDDEYTFILTNNPTVINLGDTDIIEKIYVLMAFNHAIRGIKALTDYANLDLRYAKQIIAKEWS